MIQEIPLNILKPHRLNKYFPFRSNRSQAAGHQHYRRISSKSAFAFSAHRPRILILDDSTSALDYATDAKLRKAIRELTYHPTTFIVSQRTSSICYADEIIVLDDGEVVGIGNHEQLMEQCPVYQEIHQSQFQDRKEA